MKLLITGAPGWLGSRLVEVLSQGFEGEGPWEEDLHIRLLVLPGMDVTPLKRLALSLETVEGDIRDSQSLKQAVEGVEAVLHLVGIIHPRRVSDWQTINTQGTGDLLRVAHDAGAKRFIHVSSNSVAGYTRSPHRMTESDEIHPHAGYGRSKYLAEQAVREYGESGKLETIILRPCWYYGPGQPARQTRFMGMIKKGNPIIFGKGNNLRSMSYIDNVIQAILLALKAPRAKGQVYWIADENPYPTTEIYETLAKLLDVKSFKPRHIPGLVSEACLVADAVLQKIGLYIPEIHVAGEMNKHIACSVERAKEELGYQPRVSLEEGWRRSIAWCRENGAEV